MYESLKPVGVSLATCEINKYQIEETPGNNSVLRKKNIKDIIINHKGTRIVEDGQV